MRSLIAFLLLAAPAVAADPPQTRATTGMAADGPRAAVTAVAWLPDRAGVVAGAEDGSVRVWALAGGKEVAQLPADPAGAVTALAVSPDGRRIAVARTRGGLWFWDRGGNKTTAVASNDLFPPKDLAGRATPRTIVEIAFAGDRVRVTDGDQFLATLSADGKPVGKPAAMPAEFGKGEKALIRDVATLSASPAVGVAYYEGGDVDEMRAWDFEKNELRSAVKLADRARPHAFAISPNGRLAVLGGVHDAKIQLLRVHAVATWEEVAQLKFPRPLPLPPTATFSPDGRLFAVRTGEPLTRFVVYDAARWTPLATVADLKLRALAFSPDGRRVAAGGEDGRVRLHDLRAAIDPKPPEGFDAAACWADLVSPDGVVATRAAYRLAEYPAAAIKFIREKLKPVAKPTDGDLEKWVKALDAPAFADRQAAKKSLTAVADAIDPELRQAVANNASPEAVQAINGIVSSVTRSRAMLEGDALRVYRAVQMLEMIGPPAAEALAAYAAGAKGAFLTQEAAAARGRMP